MTSLDGDKNDPTTSDTDELKIIRVNDIDLKSAVDGLEDSEDEDLEDEKSYKKISKKNDKKSKKKTTRLQIMAENQEAEEPTEKKRERGGCSYTKEGEISETFGKEVERSSGRG